MIIVHEDNNLLIAEKPQGIPTAPGQGYSFCEQVFLERPELQRVSGYRPGEGGLLNRLDNDTGGLVLFAKSDESFMEMTALLEAGRVQKIYRADVLGIPEVSDGIVSWPIGHHHKKANRMVPLMKIYKTGEPKPYRGQPQICETRWSLSETHSGWSRLTVTITKGVRHQIRVHLAAIGHPLLGDRLYGPSEWPEGVPVPEHHALWAVALDIPGFGRIPFDT